MNLATVLDIASALAIIFGIGFAIIEIRQAHRERRDASAFDIVRTVQTPEVRVAVQRVFMLPENADPELIRSDAEMLQAALAVDSACEMWGSMVFEGVVDQYMLDRMVGGWVRGTWTRLRRFVEAQRQETGNANIGEWWQWLYERLEADPAPGKELGAYVVYGGKKRR